MTLSEILSARDETQAQMAEKVGVFQTTVSAWIRGATLPPSTRLPALAKALGMPLADLQVLVAKDRKARARRPLARIVRRVHASKANGVRQ